ncbi:SUMF1/EgtB/PvdO family nonheme iron enzyme, partial [Azospirillum griseum]
ADGKTGSCTASIISRDYILTNHHCVPGKDEASRPVRALLLMNYYDETRSDETVRYDVDIRPVETSQWPDYSILRVAGNPAARFGALTLPVTAPLPSEPLIMFHHPLGQPMVLSAKGCRVGARPIDGDGQLIHYCDTDQGSSGAPILDMNGSRLIGLHYAGNTGFNLAVPMVRLRQQSVILAQLFPDQSPPPVRRAEETAPPPPPAQAQATGPRVIRDCAECPEMVVVPPGEFMMGSPEGEPGRQDEEGPQHRVTIGQEFAVGRYAVTFEEWDACVLDGGCGGYSPSDRVWGRGRRPVINVSWNDATSYAVWLSRKTGQHYRLLSEAEREYVTRAGTKTPFSTGDRITTDQANFNGSGTYNGSATGVYRRRTVEVGSFKPNAFGLYDLHGNVREWVEELWHPDYRGAPTNGSAWTTETWALGVLRGGSWFDTPDNLRSANRFRSFPNDRSFGSGFRVARTLTP